MLIIIQHMRMLHDLYVNTKNSQGSSGGESGKMWTIINRTTGSKKRTNPLEKI